MKRFVAFTLAGLMVGTLAFAQGRQHQGGQGQGPRPAVPRMAPAPQHSMPAPPPRAEARPPMTRPGGPMYRPVPRPPMPAPGMYRPGYAPRPMPPRYGSPYNGYGYRYRYGWAPYMWTFYGAFPGINIYSYRSDERIVSENTGMGYVLFEQFPLDAPIYVDGNYCGLVEQYLQNGLPVKAGRHLVEVRGYASFPINISSEQVLRIRG